MTRMVMLYDASKCTACRGCQVACKQWNDLQASRTEQRGTYENPPDLQANTYTRILFNEYDGPDRFQWLFTKWGCLHCTQAACADVCPTDALKYHETGTITVEQDLCNGCGYCAEVCPFGIPRLDSDTLTGYGKVNKCHFCQDRISNGQQPACIKTCPPGALSWGSREEMLEKAKMRVDWLKNRGYAEANVYGENELGGLGRVFVLPGPPAAHGLPEDPQYPTVAGFWQDGVRPVGVAAVGLTLFVMAFNWLTERRMAYLQKNQTNADVKEEA